MPDRQVCVVDTDNFQNAQPLFQAPALTDGDDSLEEKLRRERQRLQAGITQFSWVRSQNGELIILVPSKGNLFVQRGLQGPMQQIYDKSTMSLPPAPAGYLVGRDASAIDGQLSPDGKFVAFCCAGEIYVTSTSGRAPVVRITFGADPQRCITHGLADFVAQEEMDRYRGFWWHPSGQGLLFCRVDESHIPPYRITQEGRDNMSEAIYEDHRYPFAGQANPTVQLGYVPLDVTSLEETAMQDAQEVAREAWTNRITWFAPPREASEYLARVSWLPDGSAGVQWQNRTQNVLVLARLDCLAGKSTTLLVERSEGWVNLHHMLYSLPRAIHPDECSDVIEMQGISLGPLPRGSFSFLFASERTGFCHLYLYTYVPGHTGATLVRAVSSGDWMVESIAGIDLDSDAVYVTGTFDSCLERHLYALPIVSHEAVSLASDDNHYHATAAAAHNQVDYNHILVNPLHHPAAGVRRSFKNVMNALSGTNKSLRSRDDHHHQAPDPIRLTIERGMHDIVMDDDCKLFVDTSSDLGRPTTVKIYKLPDGGPFTVSSPSSTTVRSRKVTRRLLDGEIRLLYTLYDAVKDDKAMTNGVDLLQQLVAPELLSFPTTDGTETLHAALYRPDPRIHGNGPYPLVCAVYGGPHVQRVHRSWSQCCDMRAQRLRSLGFCVVKCDNRGSARRGVAFEGAIRCQLGRLEVLDQVAAVRHLVLRGIVDGSRIGIYGWSYGGYLAAMCLCRAPDVFHVAVAGAPVTSWDGYDTHYTERYMGLPSDNPNGYRESSVLDHVVNMRGKLLLVHGLMDENVHFRHSARLINRLIANGKDYDLLLFPDERHSPRRLRDRIYLEQRLGDFLVRHLQPVAGTAAVRAGL
jgi:dipeptidyl-peptidase-4